MRFEIKRISDGSESETPPIPGAVREDRWEWRRVADGSAGPEQEDWPEWRRWLEHGRNHGREYIGPPSSRGAHWTLKRESLFPHWFIEIDSLETLLALSRETDSPVIVTALDEAPTLEIYDDYRE